MNVLVDPVSSSKFEVLSEAVGADNSLKVIFRARLQECDVKNQNRRVYSRQVCESIVKQLAEKADNRSLLMEVD